MHVVLDSETNILNTGEGAVGTMAASPYSDRNHIVSIGELLIDDKGVEEYVDRHDPEGVKSSPHALRQAIRGEVVTIMCHNMGFDIAYLAKEWPEEFYQALPNLRFWCTMQAAYLLSGQTKVMPSLDKESFERGLPLKDGQVKEYWDQGIDTSFIPKELLLDYQKQDVYNCADIGFDQMAQMEKIPGMLALAHIKMDDIMMSTLMSINGMKFSVEKAAELVEVLDIELADLYTKLMDMAKPHFTEGFEFNPDSPKQLSTLLFGGDYEIIVDAPVLGDDGQPVRYKGGKRKGEVKTRKTAVVHTTKGFGLSTKGVPTNSNGFATGDEHLAKLSHPFTDLMRRHRELSKDAETYYRGYSALVWPDGCIRPSYNNEVAATGRQSCSSPNLQNVSKGDD